MQSITFAGLLAALELEQVDLLKIDIEGAEWEVLGDGIPGSVRSIVGEFHANGDRSPSELLRSITDANELNVQIVRDDARQLVFSASRVSDEEPWDPSDEEPGDPSDEEPGDPSDRQIERAPKSPPRSCPGGAQPIPVERQRREMTKREYQGTC